MLRPPRRSAPSRLGTRVEVVLGRALGAASSATSEPEEPAGRRGRRSVRPRSSRSSGTRRGAGVAFVALLAASALFFHGTRSNGEQPGRPTPGVVASSSAAPNPTAGARTDRLRAMVAGSQSCSDVVAAIPTIHCVFEGAEIEYRLVGADAVTDSYRAAAGPIPGGDRRGPPRCATGHAEERAWSRGGAPQVAVGRYRCAVVGGRAEMWWTEQAHGLIAHARAFDDDLAGLFVWWQRQSDR